MAKYQPSERFKKLKAEADAKRKEQTGKAVAAEGKYQTSERFNQIKEQVRTGGLTFGVDQSYIDSFNRDLKKFQSQYKSDFEAPSWSSLSQEATKDSRVSQWKDLHQRADKIRAYLNSNRASMDAKQYEDAIKNLDQTVSFGQGTVKSYTDAQRFYNSFGSQEAYDEYAHAVELSNADTDALTKELEEMRRLYDQVEGTGWYASYRMNPDVWGAEDYAEDVALFQKIDNTYGSIGGLQSAITDKQNYLQEAKAVQGYSSTYWGMDLEELGRQVGSMESDMNVRASEMEAEAQRYRNFEDNITGGAFADYSQDAMTALTEEYVKRGNAAQEAYNTARKAYAEAYDVYAYRSDLQTMEAMSQQEMEAVKKLATGVFADDAQQYLLAQGYSEDEIERLSETYKRHENQKKYEEMVEKAKSFAGQNFLTAGLSTLASYPAQLIGSVTSGLESLSQAAAYDLGLSKYSTIDPHASGYYLGGYSGAVREQVASDIKAGFTGKVGSMAYNAFNSAVDSALRLAVGGEVGSLAIAAAGSFGDSVRQASQQGASGAQAVLLGVADASLEVLTEKISIDSLLKLKDADSAKAIIGNLLKQGTSEASEETLSFIGSTLVETALLGENSDFNKRMQELMGTGLSEAEAKKTAYKELFNEGLETAVTSFLSGAIMAGGSQVQQTISKSNALTKALSGNYDAFSTAKIFSNSGVELTVKDKDMLIENLVRQGVNPVEAKYQVEAFALAAEGRSLSEKQVTALRGGQLSSAVKTVASSSNSDLYKTAAGKAATKSDKQSDKVTPEKTVKTATTKAAPTTAQTDSNVNQAIPEEKDKNSPAVSDDGITRQVSTGNAVEPVRITKVDGKGGFTVAVKGGQEVSGEDISFGKTETDMLWRTVSGLRDISVSDANMIINGLPASNASGDVYIPTAHALYTSGYYNIPVDKQYSGKIRPELETMIYKAGQRAAGVAVAKQQASVQAAADNVAIDKGAKNQKATTEKTSRKKGVVRGEGVTISDLKKTFNDTQGKAYKYLSAVAEVTGIDIVLYRSQPNAEGKYVEAQGRYRRSEPGTIYIDLNAGLSDIKNADDLAKYAMLRTFAHEFTHFIENWNPIQYNEFRKVVFDTLTQRRENVHDLIEEKQAHNPGMGHEEASREVVAEAMTDVLPDANFVQNLAEKHKTIFQKLLDNLKEFADNLREYFKAIGRNPSKEANALKERVGDTVKYLDNIIQLFDKVAVQAVENYQASAQKGETVFQTEIVGTVQEQSRVNDNETAALLSYKSGGSYLLNAKLREDMNLTEQEQLVVDGIDSALDKLPVHKGKVYRNILFDGFGDQEAREGLVAEHTIGDVISYSAYTSASTEVDGYTVEGNFIVHMEIESINGRDLEGYGNNFEHEVLFARNTLFVVNDVKYDASGTPTIYLTEVGNEETADSGGSQEALSDDYRGQQNISAESEKTEVQQVPKQDSRNGEMQTISERDSEGDSFGKEELRDVQYQQRTNTLTDRDVLAIAEKRGITGALSTGQMSTLQIFNKKNAEIGELLKQKAKQEKALKDLQSAEKPDKQAIIKTQNRIKTIEGQIKRESTVLRQYEAMDSVKGVLAKVKPTVEKTLIEERKNELAKYGTIPKGEKAVRESNLPTTTDGKNKVSRTARTVKEAEVTPNDFAEQIDKEVYLNNGLTYLPVSNDKTAKDAAAWVEKLGWTAAVAEWYRDVGSGKTGADMVARGAVLLNNAAQAGDRDTWREILFNYRLLGTHTAQGLQALRILKKLSPEDNLYMIKRSVEQMVKDMHLKTDVALDEDLLKRYKNAESDQQRDLILGMIQQSVADQIPASIIEKFTALRYVNMLGNPRTQVRNFFGNVTMKAISTVKNTIASALENFVYYVGGKKLKKTRSILVNKDLLKQAKTDYRSVEALLIDGGRYSAETAEASEFAKQVKKKRTIFKNKLLENYRTKTNEVTEQGDLLFSRAAYARALAGYLQAQGVSDMANAAPDLLDEARLFAVQEAQEQTFRDTNWLSGWVSKIGRRMDTPAVGRIIGEGVMPFRKTPANILVRTVEYSPLGLFHSLFNSAWAMRKNSEITGDQIINSWAKSLTGTGLFFLGMWLSGIGALAGGPDDDDELESFERMYGMQNYAIVFPDGTNLTFDWASPAAIPILMGAQFSDLLHENGFQWSDLEYAFTSLMEPMVEMSMLQGVKDALDNVQYAENNLGQMVITFGLNYLTQGMTNSALGQIERTFQDSREMTYVDKDSPLPGWMQRTMATAFSKVPGLDYHQVPYINAWGEEEQNPNVLLNAIYNMLSPSYVDKAETDAVYNELVRLNEAQDEKNVLPNTPEKTYEGRNLSADEYVALAKAQGQNQRELVKKLIANTNYKAMSDTDKAKAISFAYKYAKEKAQIEVLGRKAFSAKWLNEINGDVASAIIQHVKEK